MKYDFSVNERFSVDIQHIGHERQPVVIVEDFLRDPESMVHHAANNVPWGEPPKKTYPGPIAPLPEAFVDGTVNALAPIFADTFGLRPETAYLVDSFFAVVTFKPEQLHYGQSLPHVDDYYPGQLAVLLYLCDPCQGGTAMYRHRATGYESLTQEKNSHMYSLITQDLAQSRMTPQYVNADNATANRLFERTASFEAKFNRLLVYRGQVLHSMSINSNTMLDPNPRVGRLTANTFISFDLA
jgi:hypothetical protein